MAQADHQDTTTMTRVPFARAGRITDAVLDTVQSAAEAAQMGETLTDEQAKLLLLTAPQIIDELRQRRAAMDLIQDATDLHNVRFIHTRPGV